jgi:hemerythrin-like metal-binding protein
MEWTEEMSVGLYELDEDHKQLIRVINRLASESEEDPSEAVIRQTLMALVRYTEFHFAREESVMRACGYASYDGHRVLHRSFVGEVRELSERLAKMPESEAKVLRQEILAFLTNWLKKHILVEDMAYRPVVEAHQRAATEAARNFQAMHIWWSQ